MRLIDVLYGIFDRLLADPGCGKSMAAELVAEAFRVETEAAREALEPCTCMCPHVAKAKAILAASSRKVR